MGLGPVGWVSLEEKEIPVIHSEKEAREHRADREGHHLQAKDGGLRRNPRCQHRDLTLPASGFLLLSHYSVDILS